MQIVIVEHSRVGQLILRQLLEDGGHAVRSFSNGIEAYAYICANEDVDVLITSFEVAGISGLELCWDTRLLTEKSRAIYIIALSSRYDGDALEEALDCGADDFIMKPPTAQHLTARLRAAGRMLDAQRNLIALANRDPLTNLLNRRGFMAMGGDSMSASIAAGEPSAVLICDIDHFKKVNDTYGHDVGDEVIKGVAATIGRFGPLAGRLGGEEFGLFLGRTDGNRAKEIADSIRRTVAEIVFASESGSFSITVSIGVALRTFADTLRSCLKRADMALYASKERGRNRVTTDSQLGALATAA